VDDLVLALTELLTNAIEHGSLEKGDRIVTVEASVRAGTLSVAVSDSGRWHDDSTSSRHDERGRGFSILRRITDQVNVEPSQLGTTVVIERGATW